VIDSSSFKTKELEANFEENRLQSECSPENIDTASYFRTSVRVCYKREYDVFPILTS
jgi:hypothetical protein